MDANNDQFIRVANILLGTMCGLLIGLPLVYAWEQPFFGILLVLLSSTIGGFLGHRRSNSRVFMYFSLFAICVLSTIISFSMGN